MHFYLLLISFSPSMDSLKIYEFLTDYILSKKTYQKQGSKSFESGCFRRASNRESLTGAILLPTQGLLAAEFPPWPIPTRLSQPDPPWLPKEVHVDADLSADAGSTWTNGHQWSPLQAIQQNLPSSSWITRACQSSRQVLCLAISGGLTTAISSYPESPAGLA